MTRKDYAAIASVLKDFMGVGRRLGSDYVSSTVEAIALELGEVFAARNPNFDRGRFMDAVKANSNESEK